MVDKILTYNPGIVQLYDELICNAGDHAQENQGKVKDIKITVDEDSISVYNDGPGIPIKIHKEYNIYVPELIFTNFLTSSNYDDSEKRLKGGMNGLGAKLVNLIGFNFDKIGPYSGDFSFRKIQKLSWALRIINECDERSGKVKIINRQ